jgi:uncharacterized protein
MRSSTALALMAGLLIGSPVLAKPISVPTASAPKKPAGQPQRLPIEAHVKFGGRSIELEVARTPLQEQIGLMFRTSMPMDHGMVFLFDPPRPTRFWMRNTLIPLDMLFVYQGKIAYVAANVPPCTTPNCATYGAPDYNTPIDTVIELNAGMAQKLQIKVGDSAKVEFLATSPSPQKP